MAHALLLAGVRAAEPADELDELGRGRASPFCARWLIAAGQAVAVGARHLLGRQHDDRDVGGRRVGAQPLDDREPVDVGHQQVEQDDAAGRSWRTSRTPSSPLAARTTV